MVRLRHILIVDDEPSVQSLLKRVFSKEGHTVTSVSNGEEALQIVKERKTDAVILDLNLPTISGHDVCRQIRQDPSLSSIGIIVISGRSTFGLSDSCIEEGANDYMSKPFKIQELLARVRALLERQQMLLSNENAADPFPA